MYKLIIKINRKLFNTILKVGIFVFIISCSSDVLDVVPTTQLTSATFWKSKNDVDLAVNGTYRIISNLESQVIYLDVLSDNAYNNYPWEGYQGIALGTHDSQGPAAISSMWFRLFRGIGRANTVLGNFGAVPLTEEEKSSIEGEMLFLRAYFYFRLTQFYGGVPLILEPPTLEHGKLPRNSKEEVVDQVIKDLEKAYGLLPATQSLVGKATKWAAKALLARVQLHNEKYADAALSAKDVMDNGGFTLFPNYRNLFRGANENNSEVIFDAQFISPESGNFFELYLGSPNNGGGWSSVVPLPGLLDVYQMSNGKEITDSSSGYDSSNPYINRDPRLKQTIFTPGAIINGVTDANNPFTGADFKKYTEYDEDATKVITPTQYPTRTGINAILIRLTEVMLVYAEATNEATGPDATVYKAINDIRARTSVNMPPLPTGLTQAQMRRAIRYERRVELVLEGHRYFDILRWRLGETVLNGLKDPAGTRVFVSKDYLWPIPGAEFDIIGTKLVQNDGW